MALIAPATGTDLIEEVRQSLEDYGDTITDNFTGDGTTTIVKLSSSPIRTNSELSPSGTLTVGGLVQAQTTNYSINYDNGELKFVTAPANLAAVVAQYVKVVWRTERILSALNAGIRDMQGRGAYVPFEVYLLLRTLVYDYDLMSTTDVPATTSFAGDFTFPVEYNPATARGLVVKAQSRIHFAEYHPYGANRPWHPYHTFGRTTRRNFHIDGDPTPNDAIRLTCSAPLTPLADTSSVSDCPDELLMAPVWYALSALMEKKEARRARSDGYNVMQNANANPPGTQSQCVPLDAEILTRDGFRRCDEVTVGEDVLAYDPATDSCHWTPLRAINTYQAQPTVRLVSKSLNIVCTPDHKWAVRMWARRLVKASEFQRHTGHRSNAIVLAAPAEEGGSDVTPDEAALLGWVVTDGYVRYQGKAGRISGAVITQSKVQHLPEIRALVDGIATESVRVMGPRTFPSTGRTYGTLPQHVFAFKAAAARRLFERAGIRGRAGLPSLVTRLSHEARASMLDAMLKAEARQAIGEGVGFAQGHRRSGRMYVFGQKDPHVREAFQLLCALEGHALGKPQAGPEPGFVRQTVRVDRHVGLRNIRIEPGPIMDVWCPTTNDGTWVMRWRDTVCITGNTAEDYWQRYLGVMDNAQRPMRMTQRKRLSGWQWTETIR